MLLLLTWWLHHITVETQKIFHFLFCGQSIMCFNINSLAASEFLYKWVQISQICLNLISGLEKNADLSVPLFRHLKKYLLF